MKRLYAIILCTVLCSFLLTGTAFAADSGNMMNDMRDAVSTAEDMAEGAMTDAATDVKDMLDPDNGDPEAESDGKVDDSDLDNNGETGNTTNEQPTTDKVTTDNKRDTTDNKSDTSDKNTGDTTGVIEGMELEKNGMNPWAIVIAVIVVIAVLVLIFVLIPKRRR